MTCPGRRRPASPSLRGRGTRLVPYTAAAWVAALLVAASACTSEGPPSRAERSDEGTPQSRRAIGQSPADTISLLTRTREDSLIGIARGAGGIETLETQCVACHGAAHRVAGDDARASLTTCVACHESSHASERSLYAGDVRSISIPADTMYLARVSCIGCHDDATFAKHPGAPRLAALDGMCVSCHGARFAGMVERWVSGLSWREDSASAYVSQAASDGRLKGTLARVQRARQALVALRAAGAVHNVRGAHRVLQSVVDSAAAAYARAGVAVPPAPRLGPDPERNACASCHYGVEASQTTIFAQRFDHASHIVRADVACSECHSDRGFFVTRTGADSASGREVDSRHGRTRVTAASCNACHHSPTSQLQCAACHAGDERLDRTRRVVMALALKPQGAPTSRPVNFEHSVHTATPCASCHASAPDVRTVVACAQCHTDHHRERATGCVSCHGPETLPSHARDAHFACASCHARSVFTTLLPDRAFCVSCHVKQVEHVPGRECSSCHLRLTPVQVRERILATP